MPTDSLTIDEAATWITRSDEEWGTTTVTYSFATSVPSDPAFDVENFQAFNSDQQASVAFAFELWSDVCGLTFVEADPGEEGDIQFYAGDLYLFGSGDPAQGGAYGDHPNTEFCHVAFNTLSVEFDQIWKSVKPVSSP